MYLSKLDDKSINILPTTDVSKICSEIVKFVFNFVNGLKL